MQRPPDLLYLSRADVERLDLTAAACLPAIEAAFAALPDGGAVSGDKVGLFAGPETFAYAMPAMLPNDGVAGVKWVTGADNTARGLPGIAGLIVLSEIETGAITAVLDGDVITALRTAAVSLVAAKRLARPGSSRLGIVACGVQARSHFDALREVFPIADLRCFSRRRATAEAFADMARAHGIAATAVASAAEAVEGRDLVVTCVPRGPMLRQDLSPAMLAPGTFVAAPDLARSWIGAECETGFARILTDDVAQSRGLGSKGMIPWRDRFDASLADLLTGRSGWQPDTSARTIFVHAGIGLADIAVARLARQRASELGIGLRLPR